LHIARDILCKTFIISACSHDASLLDATAVSIAAVNQFRFLWGPTSLFTSSRKESSIFFQKSDKGFARPGARWKEDSRSVWNHRARSAAGDR